MNDYKASIQKYRLRKIQMETEIKDAILKSTISFESDTGFLPHAIDVNFIDFTRYEDTIVRCEVSEVKCTVEI